MYSGKKNIAKNLAVSKEVANIVMPTSDTRITDTYYKNAITAYPYVPICFAGSHLLAQEGGTPSLYIYIAKLLNEKCQQVKKLVGRGITVPALQPYRDGIVFRIFSAICGPFRYLRKRISTKYPSARVCAAVRTPWAYHGWSTCTLYGPGIRSSRWGLPLPMSKFVSSRQASMRRLSKSVNFKIFGPSCSVPV